MKKYNSIAEMVLDTIEMHENRICMRWWDDATCTKSSSRDYGQLRTIMQKCFGGLKSLGFQAGDHLAICAGTRPSWVYADLGIQALGASTTALYPSLKPKEMLYILKDSESKMIFLEGDKNLAKILEIWDELPDLRTVIIFDTITISTDSRIISLADVLSRGEEFLSENPTSFIDSVNNIKPDTLSSIIYTSGTTGVPKGVMLTNNNFLSMAYMSISVIATMLGGNEKPWEMDFLTILPMSHSFGRGCDEYCVLYAGASMNFAGGFNPFSVKRSFEEFHPSILLSVPYFFQKIQNMVFDEVAALSPTIQKIFQKAVANGHLYITNLVEGKKNPFKVKFLHATLDNLIGKVVKKKLGGKIIGLISGSAKISTDLLIFFNALGINLTQGYGLTETSPVTHLGRTKFNSRFRPEFNDKIPFYEKIHTIGPPINVINCPYGEVQQKLSESGELLLKGPQIMPEYWRKPEMTKRAIDEEGWFHTGDLCKIDEDGYVTITGRAKLVIKLLTAKMISPAAIESLIVPTSKKIAQFLLAGDDTRKYLTCLVVPFQKPMQKYAEEHGIAYKTWKDLITHPEILQLIKQEILDLTKDVSEYARPKKFAISSAALTAEDEFITPSFKYKREKIFTKLKEAFDTLYAGKEEFLVIEERMTDFYDQSLIIA